ncbi:MAG: response regulator [Acidimicrobiales bacterium]
MVASGAAGAWANDASFGRSELTSIGGTIVAYGIAGATLGWMAARLREVETVLAARRARDEVAATLHDGVLQTLAVVARRSATTLPDVAALARRTDRELRLWLFGGGDDDTDLEAALRRAAQDVGLRHDLPVTVSVVADGAAPPAGVIAAGRGGARGGDERGQARRRRQGGGLRRGRRRRRAVRQRPRRRLRVRPGAARRRRGHRAVDQPPHRRGRRAGRARQRAGPRDGGQAVGALNGGPIRTVLADDHAVVRSGLRAELGDRFEVVGEADDAEGAIDVIAAHRPDLVVCDLHTPRGGGLAVVKACATLCPIVILTVSEAERDLLDAVAGGAAGYLLKTMPTPELREALARAAAGEPVFSPSLAALVLGEFRRLARAGANPLTEREPRGAAARGPGADLRRDRAAPRDLAQDGREPCPQHPGQAAAVPPGRSGPLRGGARARLRAGVGRRPSPRVRWFRPAVSERIDGESPRHGPAIPPRMEAAGGRGGGPGQGRQ